MHSNPVLPELLPKLTIEGPSEGLRRDLYIPHDMRDVLCIHFTITSYSLTEGAYSVLAKHNIFFAGHTWSIVRIHDVRP